MRAEWSLVSEGFLVGERSWPVSNLFKRVLTADEADDLPVSIARGGVEVNHVVGILNERSRNITI